ncbi:hypothetical protein [Microseira wollei]|nr:hypothetical protein [Microseira wollei]
MPCPYISWVWRCLRVGAIIADVYRFLQAVLSSLSPTVFNCTDCTFGE